MAELRPSCGDSVGRASSWCRGGCAGRAPGKHGHLDLGGLEHWKGVHEDVGMSDVCSVVQVAATNANGDVVHVLYTIRATLMQAGRGLPLLHR